MSSMPHSAFGLAFKPQHVVAIEEDLAAVDFFEIHAENYLGDGGPPHQQLAWLAAHRPLSVHGVGLSLGGMDPPDSGHLQRLRRLLSRYPAWRFSEHLAWNRHAGWSFPDLLPIPYDEASLRRVGEHIDCLQSELGRRVLIENPSSYLAQNDPLEEVDFIARLQRETGCGLLLDLNNVVVSCHNLGGSPTAYLERFPLAAVEEIHLAGHSRRQLGKDDSILIDDHGSPCSDDVVALYVAFLRRAGPRPTLIEWDNALPAWPVLRAELQRIRAAAAAATHREAA